MKVAITGGSGQLGTHLLRRLLRDSAITEIVSLDRRPPLLPGGKLRAVEIDVRDPDIGRHLAGCDALIHLAFIVTQHLPRAEFESINILGSRNVIDAAVAAGVRHVLYASSVAAYGVLPGQPVPIVEDTPRRYQPDFPYAAAKFEVEAYLDHLGERHPELLITRMRPVVLVGERMENVLGGTLRHRVLLDLGPAPVPVVWDEDVADAFMLALKGRHGGAFNLCADESLDARGLAAAAGLRLLHLPRAALVVTSALGPLLERLGLGPAADPAWLDTFGVTMLPSSERAKTVLGWRPRFPTAADVLRRYVAVAPRGLDPRLRVFFRTVDILSQRTPPRGELVGLRAQVHLHLTGPSGGDVALLVEDGRVRIGFTVPRPPTAVVTLSADLLLDLINERADLAAAQSAGKLRVEGEGHAATLLGGLLGTFRTLAGAGRPGRILGQTLLTYLGTARHEEAPTGTGE